MRIPRFDPEYRPVAADAGFDRPEVLYLAALFHDIAKGRGGDHSHLGARDAVRFCNEHGLSRADGGLVAWLVDHHLVMSATAQKQDLTDPEVISGFATLVRDERTLVALYILTVADIRGTSPAVWNAWKGKLLEDLFRSTRRILRGETDYAASAIKAKKAEALRIFRTYVPDPGKHEPCGSSSTTATSALRGERIPLQTRTLGRGSLPTSRSFRARLSPVASVCRCRVRPDHPDSSRASRLLRAHAVRRRGRPESTTRSTASPWTASRCSRVRAPPSTTAS